MKRRKLRGKLVNKALKPQKCEDCGQELERGQNVVYTLDSKPEQLPETRFWHEACFDKNLTPMAEWAKP